MDLYGRPPEAAARDNGDDVGRASGTERFNSPTSSVRRRSSISPSFACKARGSRVLLLALLVDCWPTRTVTWPWKVLCRRSRAFCCSFDNRRPGAATAGGRAGSGRDPPLNLSGPRVVIVRDRGSYRLSGVMGSGCGFQQTRKWGTMQFYRYDRERNPGGN